VDLFVILWLSLHGQAHLDIVDRSIHHVLVAIEDSLFRDVPYGLILGLYPNDRGWRFWQGSQDTECLNAMSQIELGRMVGFLPYLAPLLFRRSPVRENAARTLAQLFRTDLQRSLTFLSQGLGRRVHYETRAADELRQISAQSTRTLDVPSDHAWAAFGVLSFHGSGWVREAAVEKLAEVAGGMEIPFLLYRANDWVDLVAKRALVALETRLRTVPIRSFSEHLATLFELRSRQRGHLSGFHEKVIERIARHEEIGFLSSAARASASIGLRRWILSVATSAAAFRSESVELARELRNDKDPAVRANAWARIWADQKNQIDLREGLTDPWPTIRRRCLELLCDAEPAQHRVALNGALFDVSSLVRATARLYLARVPGSNPNSVYRERLQLGETAPPAALFGIAESGKREWVVLLVPFLRSSRVCLRRAAVFAIGSLDASSFAAEIRAALLDPSPKVSKAAGMVLEKHRALASNDFLEAALSAKNPIHVRRTALRLISTLSKWDQVVMLLKALGYAPEFRTVIHCNLRRWQQQYNRSFATPSDEQLANLASLIGIRRASLPAEMTRDFESIVGIFQR
jgi:HEAT repeat protein